MSDFVRIETDDGGADLYGYDRLESGFMVNHVEGAEAWDVITGPLIGSLSDLPGQICVPVAQI